MRRLRAEGGEVGVPVDGRREASELVDRQGGVGRGAGEAGVDVVDVAGLGGEREAGELQPSQARLDLADGRGGRGCEVQCGRVRG